MNRLAAIALLSLTCGIASAQDAGDKSIDVTWRAFTTSSGCIFYEGDLLNMVPEAPKATATFSGACKSGEAITGTGTITLKRVVNDINTTRTYKGTVKGGYLDGRITIVDSYVGIADKADKGSSPANTFTYRMGCMVLSDSGGQLASGSIGNQIIQCRAKTANVPPENAL
ncbi:MAG TPA: hypothetical protein VGO52_10865 [Hyphomonadaceae bacterium]|jgi:hypothetical protein|nr:hypothetical protein [Hyphomonadaceae bacterium]